MASSVTGGSGFTGPGFATYLENNGYRYNPATGQWERVPALNPFQPQADAINSAATTQEYNIEHGPGGLDTQEQGTRLGYGFLQGDPNDPFSRAALLQKSYENNVRGSTNNMAARGQLYSGALVNAQNANTQNYQQGVTQGQRDEQRLINDIAFRRQGAKDALATGTITNSSNALSSALQSPPPDVAPGIVPGIATAPSAPAAPRPPAIRRVRTGHRRRPAGGHLY